MKQKENPRRKMEMKTYEEKYIIKGKNLDLLEKINSE